MTIDVESTYRRFLDRQLPTSEWTHEAHLAVCWQALQSMPPGEALPLLRGAIRAHNDTVGTINSDSSGYHETITAYYVGAVADLDASTFDRVVASPLAGSEAPLRHWSRDRLFTVEARRGWLDPDLEPLGFDTPSGAGKMSG